MKREKTQMALKIAELRKSAGMSTDDVGKVCGRTGKAVAAWEAGISEPSAESLIAMCRLFDAPISAFYPSELSNLTVDEVELISAYRDADDEGRKAIRASARAISRAMPKIHYSSVSLNGVDGERDDA